MPMMFNSQEDHSQENQAQAGAQERRYDPETLQKVAVLATRLQHEHQEQPTIHEHLTAGQMEAIGLEVGLRPEFVQQALAQLEEDRIRLEQEKQRQDGEEKQRQEQLAEQRRLHEQTTLHKTALQTQTKAGNAEFYSACAAMAIPFVFGFLAWHFKSTQWMGGLVTDGYSHPITVARPGMLAGFTLITPAPLALMMGFLAGKRRVAFAASMALLLTLAPSFPFLAETSQSYYYTLTHLAGSGFVDMFAYVMLGLPIVGLMAVAGAWARKTYFPFGGKSRDNADAHSVQHKEYAPQQVAPVPSQPYMQNMAAQPYAQNMTGQSYAQNVAAQPYMHNTAAQPYAQNVATQPYAQTQPPVPRYDPAQAPMQATPNLRQNHRAYLSLDVSDKEKLRQSATLVAVDYSFKQFRSWVEEIARGCGGEMEAGVNLMATFPTDAQAMRAARLLQERLPQFNQSLNRLPLPFQLRAAVSAGEAGFHPASQRSAALLRAASPGDTIISSEVGAAALAELGQLTPAPSSLMGDMAFVWKRQG